MGVDWRWHERVRPVRHANQRGFGVLDGLESEKERDGFHDVQIQ